MGVGDEPNFEPANAGLFGTSMGIELEELTGLDFADLGVVTLELSFLEMVFEGLLDSECFL